VQRRFLSAPTLDDARHVMETDFWAQAEMCRVFAPALLRAPRGSAAIVNVLSIGALFCLPEYASYCAAKAAGAILTQGLRAELHPHGVFVAGVFPGAVTSRMSAKNPRPKMSAVDHAAQVIDAVENGVEDIFSGSGAEEIRAAIHADAKAFEHGHIARFHTSPMA
jgi:NAD(P)-dependent dehydrogenase (short-subunit alcohol dehydrogenase family)